MRQRTPYKRKADGPSSPEATPGTAAPALSRIAAEIAAEPAPAPERAVEALSGKPQLNRRDEQLREWRQQGLSGTQAKFFASHSYMMDHPNILAAAADAAKEGCRETDIEPDSPEYFEVLRMSYDEFSKPTPKYFELPGSEPSGSRERSAIVSAPVERTVPTGNYRDGGPIRLTADQLDAARIAGVPPSVYAEQLQRLREAKENGQYLGQP